MTGPVQCANRHKFSTTPSFNWLCLAKMPAVKKGLLYRTSERFELVLQVKFLSSQSRQVNAEVGADGILLKCPAHLMDPLHHCVWRRAYHIE